MERSLRRWLTTPRAPEGPRGKEKTQGVLAQPGALAPDSHAAQKRDVLTPVLAVVFVPTGTLVDNHVHRA